MLVLPFQVAGNVGIATTGSVVTDIEKEIVSFGGWPYQNLAPFIANLIKLLIILSFLAGFFYFLWGALGWITSSGDKGGLQTAKDKMSAAIIGLLLVAFAFIIIKVVERFLGLAIITGGIKWPSP